MDAGSIARLRRNLAAATDEALVALANRGLVRRATKDLEQSGSFRVELTGDGVLVHGEDWTVTMPAAGPTKASDTSPATGITRHIIAATIFLRDHCHLGEIEADSHQENHGATGNRHDDSSEDPVEQRVRKAAQCLIDANANELFKWSGKTPLLEASVQLPSVGKTDVCYSPQLKIEFIDADVRVILMTDRPEKTLRLLLNQFKTTVAKSEHSRWVMLAVLALKKSAGIDAVIQYEPGAELTDALRGDRKRISHRAQILLASVAASGIANPSSRIVLRFRTTSVEAEAARFPRLGRLLNSIADDAQLQIARDAAADPARMMQRMAVAQALADSTSKPENSDRIDLFGRSRSNYFAEPELQLCGLGTFGWRTASGFEGLTTIYWDVNGKRFLTASVSRGEGQDRSFSLGQAYNCGLGWSGGTAVNNMCRRHVTLNGAKTNVEGRLSLSESCHAQVGIATNPTTIDFGDRIVRNWSELRNIANRSQPIGLRLPDPRESFVVVSPAQWGTPWFDELEQAFVWEILDDAGTGLQVRVPWTDVDENSVAFLESLKIERECPTAIMGRVEVQNSRIHVYPFSVFSGGTPKGDMILCPQFDQDRIRSRNESLLQRLRKKFKREQTVQIRMGEEDSDETANSNANDLTRLPPLIRNLFLDVDNILSEALESGATDLVSTTEETVAHLRDQFQALGVVAVADSLSAILKNKDTISTDLLRATYRLQLFLQSTHLSQLH